MSDYEDQLIAGEQPQGSPDLIPANDTHPKCEILVQAPEIDGVPCTLEEKRFHDQATAVIERECREGLVGDPPTEMHGRLRRAEQQAADTLRRWVQTLDYDACLLASTLQEYDPGTLGIHNVSICDPLGSAFASCARVMEQIARLTGRRMPHVPLLLSLDRIEQTAGGQR